MFGRQTRRERSTRGADRSLDRGGYPGLEGDFESERRRAAAADHDTIEPYEHDEGAVAVLPVTEPGLTHP
ncbi:hypothetical protein RCH12_001457 [Cryobacterium sp. MP_3.1]|uniref:Uncharacterized protein n=1 Tax=Cryobacterium zongtaii TaxID=1259217 RepID=A0A2S3ZAV2_9MICO|nr:MULTISPECIES: hypothetical protein [Cryobacterium]ASD22905.1 hypothetical protein B7495_13065 [Cryobacterium sp. LW097]MEC5183998.1 hypothetical protein [Cryobacterium sp. MP_3.1]POH62684.1 hypothetical protein C3B61_17805 [Cryobacterium zongtaii]TFC50275.1 hypothetical protein E3O68_17855 [Cryobacterium sp. TMB3-1-2]TFC60886.1 hypothetical protein E3O60_06235 [Cryobacterium sp. TMB1-7]